MRRAERLRDEPVAALGGEEAAVALVDRTGGVELKARVEREAHVARTEQNRQNFLRRECPDGPMLGMQLKKRLKHTQQQLFYQEVQHLYLQIIHLI